MKRQDRKRFLFPAHALSVAAALVLGGSSCGGDDAAAVTATQGPATAPAKTPAVAPAASGQTENAQGIFENGQMLSAQGDPAGAVAEFRRATALDPGMAEAHLELGKILVQQSYNVAAATRDQGVLGEGIAELVRAAELRPGDAEYAYWAGRALSVDGQNDEALKWLEKATELDPDHGLAFKRMAMVHAQESRGEQAIECLRKAMELLPDDGGVPFQLGNLLEGNGDLEGARDAYRRSIEIDPTLPGPYAKLGKILSQLGDDEGAATALEEFGRWKSFDDELKKRLQQANQKPDDVPTLLSVGEMYFSAEKWADAEVWYSRALAIDPSNAVAHLYRGIVMRHLGEYEIALNHLLEASFLAPDSFDPHLELIRLYAAMGDEDKLAEKLAELDGELGPENVDERLIVAAVLLDAGRKEEAAERYEAVLASAPDNATAKAGLAKARGE